MSDNGAPDLLPTSDAPTQQLELPGGPLAFVDEGPRDATPLLALHGIPGSVRDFRYLAPQLSDAVRFVRVDLPGFGASAPVADAIDTLAGRRRVLLALADHLGLQRFAVLGHSMGGATALSLAAAHPDRVRGLALLASIGLRPHRGLGMSPRRFALLGRGFGVPLLGRVFVRVARDRYRRRGFPGADQMDAAAFGLHFRAIGAADFREIRRAVAGPLPPTLVAYARDDHMLETEIQEELARALPRARVLAFDAGGHNIQKTRALEIARAIKQGVGAEPA